MSGERIADELLRLRAIEALGPLGDELAREALERGAVAVEHDVLAWEGSHGTRHGHRVYVTLASELHERVVASHMAMDALSAALATAMAERPGQSMSDVHLEPGLADPLTGGPYRSARSGQPP